MSLPYATARASVPALLNTNCQSHPLCQRYFVAQTSYPLYTASTVMFLFVYIPPETSCCARTTPYFHHLPQPRRQPETIAWIILRVVVSL